MKDKFYRNRMILRIVMYLILYSVFFIWFLYRFRSLGVMIFQGLNGLSFIIYGAMVISFITTAIMIVSLILEMIAKKGGKHIFTIVQLIIAVAVNIILWRYIYGHSNLGVFYLCPALDFIVWICWLAEFIMRKKKSAVKGDEKAI